MQNIKHFLSKLVIVVSLFQINPSSGFMPGLSSQGYISYQEGTNNEYICATLDSQERILAAGTIFIENTTLCFLTRHLTNGSLDTSFGINGRKTFERSVLASPVAIAVDTQNRILICGTYYDPQAGSKAAVVRLLSDGSLDNLFGTGGVVRVNAYNSLNNLAFDGDSIILVGRKPGSNGPVPTGIIIKIDSSGSLDTTFNNNSGFIENSDVYEYNAVAVDSQHRIIASGSDNTPFDQKGYITRYKYQSNQWVLDSDFNSSGYVRNTSSISYNSFVLTQNDSIIACGQATGSGVIARYKSNGEFDTTFAGTGCIYDGDITVSNKYYSISLDKEGRILVAGYGLYPDQSYNGVIARYTSAGALDTTFAKTGYINEELGTYSHWFKYCTTDSYGRVLAVGRSNNNTIGSQWGLIVRFFAQGSFDAPTAWTAKNFIEHYTQQGKKLGLL